MIARGVSSSEACRTVKVKRRTGTRWLYGRTVPARDGSSRQYAPVITPPRPATVRSTRYLGEEERLIIADRRRANVSMRAIARELDRDVSTISRELARNADPAGRYRPAAAQRLATARLARPRARKLATDPVLAALVQGWLDTRWSPEQISHSLRLAFPHDPARQLATATIYQALYAKAAALQRDPGDCLRTGRRRRRPHRRSDRRRPQPTSGPGARRSALDQRSAGRGTGLPDDRTLGR